MKSFAFLLFFITLVVKGTLFANSSITYEETVIKAPKGEIIVEIADDPIKYKKGLGYRQSLPEGSGMLFIFKIPSRGEMCMRGMNFPIDMVWLDSNKKVTKIKENIYPDVRGEIPQVYFSSNPDTFFVLELPKGGIEQYGIKEGIILSFTVKNNL